MHARALALLAALVMGCARAHPKPPAATSVTKLATTATCADGELVPRGKELPRMAAGVFGAPVSDTSARADAVTTGACAVNASIRKCWVDRKHPLGSLELRLSISPEGKLLQTKRSGGSVDDADFEGCLAQALAGTTFAAAAAGDTTYELSFTLRKVKLTEAGTDIQGRIDPADLKRVIRQNFPRLRDCYTQFLKNHGDVDGVLTFDLVIRRDGKVKSLNVDFSESFNNKDLLTCAAEVMSHLVFPEPDSLVIVHYPIAFETTTE